MNLIMNAIRIAQKIPYQIFQNQIKIYVNATVPPTLGSLAIPSVSDMIIYVPAESVNSYKGATGWIEFADKIQALP